MVDNLRKISVIIPFYQSSQTIERAVSSALNQSYSNIEIVVIDNGSTDESINIIEKMQSIDNRINIVRLEKNKRPAGGRNAGVKNSSGEYIAFLDSDDEWSPKKLEYQMEAFNNSEIGIVLSDGLNINNQENQTSLYSEMYAPYINRMKPLKMNYGKELYNFQGPVRKIIYEKCIVNLSSVIMRKEHFFKVGSFNESLYGPEDMDLWVKLAKITNFAYIDIPLVNRYITRNSVSLVSQIWLESLLNYHKNCYQNSEYSDLKDLVLMNLEKYYRLLIIYFGSNAKRKESVSTCAESLRYGVFLKVIFYSLLTLMGKRFFLFCIEVYSRQKNLKEIRP